MKRFGLLVTMILASSLLFTGCGNSSNGNGVASIIDDDNPIVVIPPVGGGDTGGDTGDDGDDGENEIVGEIPVIHVKGQNPVEVIKGDDYEDRGATALDDEDGDISDQIVMDDTGVDTSTVGTYTVTFNVTDSDGNAAEEVTRTVNVVEDDTPPVIQLIGQNPQFIVLNDPYQELNASATDDHDGDISGEIVIDSSDVNTSSVGSYTVTYNVTDDAGNPAEEVTRTVNVGVDGADAAPVLTLLGDDPQVILLDNPYNEQGATAIDDLDGDISHLIQIDHSDVNTSEIGAIL